MGNEKFVYLLLGLIVILGVFFTFNNNVKDVNEVNLIDSNEFEGLIDDAFVLQVHTPYYGEIEGTDLVIEDWENIELYLDDLPNDRKIAIYCRSGRMSGIVAEQLAELGYEVYDLDGGMKAWEASGRELIVR